MTEILHKPFVCGSVVLSEALLALMRSLPGADITPGKQMLSTEHKFIEGLKGSRFNKTVLTLPYFLLLFINQ